MFLQRYVDAVLNICSQSDVPNWFCLSNISLSESDFASSVCQHGHTTFIDVSAMTLLTLNVVKGG